MKEQAGQIGQLCREAGCSDEVRKIHFVQYVEKRWNPHPPQTFLAWWSNHPEHRNVKPVIAFNIARFRIQWYVANQCNLTHEQAARIETTLRGTNPAILRAHAEFLVRRGKLKPEEVEAWVTGDPVRDLFEAIRLDKPLRPVLQRMIWLRMDGKDYSVLDDPPEMSPQEWFNKMKAMLKQIGKPMPKITKQDVQDEARRMGLKPSDLIEPIDFEDGKDSNEPF